MSDKLRNDDYSLEKLFSRNIFEIPEYQRYYSWGKSNLNDLWNDLTNIMGEVDREHYMGTVICKYEGKESAKEFGGVDFFKYHTVDGQQRITTLVILINAIVSELEGYLNKNKTEKGDIQNEIDNIKKRFLTNTQIGRGNSSKLVLQGDDQDVLSYILDDYLPNDIPLDTPSGERLVEAWRFYKEKLKKVKKENDDFIGFIDELIQRIRELQFMVYQIESEEQATLIFESVNDRGKGLTNLEKTKSFLMHKLYLSVDNPGERTKKINNVKRNFKIIYKSIQDIEYSDLVKDVDEDAVQRYHFISYMPQDKVKEYLKKNDFNNYTRRRAAPKYLDLLKWWFEELYSKDKNKCVNMIDDYTQELQKFFKRFDEISQYNEDDIINWELIKIFTMGRVANFYPLIVTAWDRLSKLAKNEFADFLQLVEVAAFRIYGIGNRRSNTGQSRFYNLAHDLYKDSSLEEIKDELKEAIDDYEPDDDFINDLKTERFYKKMTRSDIRYLFYFYDQRKRDRKKGVDIETHLPMVVRNSDNKFTIDHIWPQKGNKLNLNEEEKVIWEKSKHRLGNLTLATGQRNSSWKDNPYEKKRNRYEDSDFEITREIYRKFDNWNLHGIQQREEALIEFAKKRWSKNRVERNLTYSKIPQF